jgi:hypothetical protein
MTLAMSPEESLKYRIVEGKYQKFMAWMGNAIMGRTNPIAILVFETASSDTAVQFLSKCLPGIRVANQFRCNQDVRDNVIVYRDVYPKRSRQRDFVRSLMQKSNVVLVNPPAYWADHTTLPVLRIDMMVDQDTVNLASTFATMAVKFHVFSNIDAFVDLNDALAEKSPVRSFRELARAYKDLNYSQYRTMRNTLAMVHISGMDTHIDFRNQTIEGKPCGPPIDESDLLTVPRFVVQYYDKGPAMVQWLSRCAMGIPALNMAMVIEDTTTTTIDMIRAMFGNQRVAYLSDANQSSLHYITDTSYYMLYVFDRLTLPLIDLVNLCKYSSVVIVDNGGAYLHFEPRIYCLHARYIGNVAFPIGSRLAHDGFAAYAREAYDVTIKEPACVVYLEKALAIGRYKWNQDISIDDIVLDYTAWCALQNVPPWVYMDIVATRRNLATATNTYFRCSMNDTYVRFSGSRKVIVG